MAPDRLAALPAPSLIVGAVEVERRDGEIGGVLACRHRVAEGERGAARAAGVGRRAAVVEGQRRRAAAGVDRHRLAEIDGQGDDLRRCSHCRCRW